MGSLLPGCRCRPRPARRSSCCRPHSGLHRRRRRQIPAWHRSPVTWAAGGHHGTPPHTPLCPSSRRFSRHFSRRFPWHFSRHFSRPLSVRAAPVLVSPSASRCTPGSPLTVCSVAAAWRWAAVIGGGCTPAGLRHGTAAGPRGRWEPYLPRRPADRQRCSLFEMPYSARAGGRSALSERHSCVGTAGPSPERDRRRKRAAAYRIYIIIRISKKCHALFTKKSRSHTITANKVGIVCAPDREEGRKKRRRRQLEFENSVAQLNIPPSTLANNRR